MEESFHSQSTKQMYKYDIEDSINHKTVHKIYEFIDDYSYGKSKNVGIYIREKKDKNKYEIILFMEDPIKEKKIIKKLLEWRKSGKSNEIGHKGGGNKRNIFGYNASKVSIISKIDKKTVIETVVYPKKIYEFSIDDNINEDKFRKIIDTSDFLILPKNRDIDEDMSSSYSKLYNVIKSESKIEPNFMINIEIDELKNLPNEFKIQNLYQEFINQIRAKQYNIVIKFKNELLEDKEYKKYKNIDLVGFNWKTNIKEYELLLCDDQFYINNVENNKMYDVIEKKCIESNSKQLIQWGKITTFVADKQQIEKELKEYNNLLEKENYNKTEDFYGIYILLNNKLTNYKAICEDFIPGGRNNNIIVKDGKKSSSNYFRIIIKPNEEICKDIDIFEKIIKTETIKAKTNFCQKSCYKKIIKLIMDLYRKKEIMESKPKPNPKPNPKSVKSHCYIIYLGKDLWKFGLSKDEQFKNRINTHLKESTQKIEEFTGKKASYKNATVYYKSKQTDKPRSKEEMIKNLLIQKSKEDQKIKMFENKGNKSDTREYFICDDHDYILEHIISQLD